jgi:sterol desaturase/sphingolipid hydroxylase (fatty acid hydroxylase superfamily)
VTGLWARFEDPTLIAAAAAIPLWLWLYAHPSVRTGVQRAGCALAYAGIIAITVARGAYVPAAVSLVFFLGFETWRRRCFADLWNREALLNLAYVYVLLVVAEPVGAELGKLITRAILAWQGFGWGLQSSGLPPVVQGVLLFVAYDLRRYWTHRLEHNVRVLWRIHKHHHSSTEMTVLAATRDHPLYPLEEAALATATILLVGPDPVVILPTMATYYTLVKLNHLGIELPRLSPSRELPWWAFIISTPTFHGWHHTVNCRYDANLADNLPIWDVLFGTYEQPDPDRRRWTYGLVASEKLPASFAHSMLTPIQVGQSPDRDPVSHTS